MTLTALDISKMQIAQDYFSFDEAYHTACRVKVDLSMSSKCDFAACENQAHFLKSKGAKIIWHLEFDFAPRLSDFKFEGIFNAYYDAIKLFNHFVKERFLQETLGYILFEGFIDFRGAFAWSEGDFIEFKEWLIDLYQTPSHLFETEGSIYGLGEIQSFEDMSKEMFDVTPFCRHLKNVYALNVFSAYLHRLLAALIEEVPAFIEIHYPQSDAHLGFVSQLFSEERLSHIHLFSGSSHVGDSCNIGLCLPNDPYCLESILHNFKNTYKQLVSKNICFKIVPEFMMTASWDGLDKIVYIKKGLSPQGKRILQGFCAAGGIPVYVDEKLGVFENEQSFEEFLREY